MSLHSFQNLLQKKDVEKLINSLADLFGDVIIEDLKLKVDVAVILSGMILKHISDVDEQIKLLEMVDMRQYIDIMEELVYDKYGDQLKEIDDQLKEKDSQLKEIDDQLKEKDSQLKEIDDKIKQYKDDFKELSQIDGLPPKAKSIIDELSIKAQFRQ